MIFALVVAFISLTGAVTVVTDKEAPAREADAGNDDFSLLN